MSWNGNTQESELCHSIEENERLSIEGEPRSHDSNMEIARSYYKAVVFYQDELRKEACRVLTKKFHEKGLDGSKVDEAVSDMIAEGSRQLLRQANGELVARYKKTGQAMFLEDGGVKPKGFRFGPEYNRNLGEYLIRLSYHNYAISKGRKERSGYHQQTVSIHEEIADGLELGDNIVRMQAHDNVEVSTTFHDLMNHLQYNPMDMFCLLVREFLPVSEFNKATIESAAKSAGLRPIQVNEILRRVRRKLINEVQQENTVTNEHLAVLLNRTPDYIGTLIQRLRKKIFSELEDIVGPNPCAIV